MFGSVKFCTLALLANPMSVYIVLDVQHKDLWCEFPVYIDHYDSALRFCSQILHQGFVVSHRYAPAIMSTTCIYMWCAYAQYDHHIHLYVMYTCICTYACDISCVFICIFIYVLHSHPCDFMCIYVFEMIAASKPAYVYPSHLLSHSLCFFPPSSPPSLVTDDHHIHLY